MVIRSWTRAPEKRFLRPLGRVLPRGRRGESGDRLEQRVEELESLVRELAGLVSVALDERPVAATRSDGEKRPARDPGSREAA